MPCTMSGQHFKIDIQANLYHLLQHWPAAKITKAVARPFEKQARYGLDWIGLDWTIRRILKTIAIAMGQNYRLLAKVVP